MLRWFASLHGNVACVTVERTLNLDYSDGFGGGAVTSESVRRLADLIDPTCERDEIDFGSGRAYCMDCRYPLETEYKYCPHCGARVVDDE